MADAWVGGREATLDAAIAAGAALLAASRCAVIAGLGTDVAGAEAAVALAAQIGGAFDHRRATAALRDLDTMRQAGWIVCSPPQARALADLVLLVGSGPGGSWNDWAERLRLGAPPPLAADRPRRVICLGARSPYASEAIDAATDDVPILLGALRALVAGRRHGNLVAWAPAISRLAKALPAARYGVALWSAEQLDALSIEMLCGLIDDLNRRTRFAGLPIPPDDNAAGVVQAGCWRSGYPFRVGFGRSAPEHDPWRFDAARIVESGEADAAVWISALSAEPPPWQGRVPLIALVAEGTAFAAPPEVAITVGYPGIDHDAVLFDRYLGTLVAESGSARRELPSVSDVVARIAGALPGAAPC